jgi:hypothetical protein
MKWEQKEHSIFWRKESLRGYMKVLFFQILLLMLAWAYFTTLVNEGSWIAIFLAAYVIVGMIDLRNTWLYVKQLQREIKKLEETI